MLRLTAASQAVQVQHRLLAPRLTALPGRRCLAVNGALGVDTIHINEDVLLAGSAAASVTIPLAHALLGSRGLFSLSASDVLKQAAASNDSSAGLVIIDVRTEEQRARQGIPVLPAQAPVALAPWLISSGSGVCRTNPHFTDEVMFAAHVAVPGTTVVILDQSGEVATKAAAAVAKLGHSWRVGIVSGGFEGWKAAGLPVSMGTGSSTSASDTDAPDDVPCHVEHEVDRQDQVFRPKILDVLAGGYSAQELKQDVMAGVVVGVIALSLSMALGIASESTPAIGLTTAVIAGFVISALGGSRVGIGGPTAAFIPIVVGVAHQYGPDNLIVCTGLAGLMMMGMGMLRLGSVVRYVPKPVVTGFTAGIATYILSTQVKDFFGLGVPGALPEGHPVPSQFLEKLYFLGSHLDSTHVPSLILAVSCLGLTLAWPKAWAKIAPPQIVAVIVGTAGLVGVDAVLGGSGDVVSAATGPFGIETIGSHYGMDAIPVSLPAPHWPSALKDPSVLLPLMQPAFNIALLASIESLLCVRVADVMIEADDKHNPNTELIAQGVANVASAAFGGLPATGALARTAANVRAGGRSPIAGCVHAATILAIMMAASPVAVHIPLPALSAVLVVVALNMGEWYHFRQLPSWPEKDAQLFLLAFFLTVMQDVAVAVEVGMLAAVLLFVRDVTGSLQVSAREEGDVLLAGGAQPTSATRSPSPPPFGFGSVDGFQNWEDPDVDDLRVPYGVACIDVTGSLLFGAGHQLEKAVERVVSQGNLRVIVLGMSHLSTCDISGLEVLEEVHKALTKRGLTLLLMGPTQQPLQMMSKAGFLKKVGKENVMRTLPAAMQRAEVLVQAAPVKPSPRHFIPPSNNIVNMGRVPVAPPSKRSATPEPTNVA